MRKELVFCDACKQEVVPEKKTGDGWTVTNIVKMQLIFYRQPSGTESFTENSELCLDCGRDFKEFVLARASERKRRSGC